jgi:hypothetical protein
MTMPSFGNFDDLDLSSLRDSLGDVEIPTAPIEPPEPSVKRPRGRPRGSGRKTVAIPVTESYEDDPKIFAPAPLTKRDEKDIAIRLEAILTGVTGIPSMMLEKEYMRMTDEEANGIAVPLASYLSRNVDTIPVARQIIENYDIAGVLLGLMMYAMRLYRDRRLEVAANNAAAEQAASKRVAQRSTPSEERSEDGNVGRTVIPGASSYGISSPI